MAVTTNNKNQVLAKLTKSLLCWLLPWLALMPATASTQDLQVISSAQMLMTTTDHMPPATAEWQAAALPWLQSFAEAADQPGYVWLRFTLPAPDSDEKLGMLITRHMRNLNVYVNGQLLHAGRSDPARDYLGWNTPLLVELQTATMSRAQNEIVLSLYQSVGSSYVNAPIVGPWSAVEPRYSDSYFAQVQIPFIALITCSVLGLLTFGLWVMRRERREYLYFCASSMSWAMVMLHMALPRPLLMDLKSWITLSYFNINFAALAFLAFVARMLRFHLRKWLRAWLMLIMVACLSILALPPRIGFALAIPLQASALLALLAMSARTLLQYKRRRDSDSAWVTAALLALLILPAFDMFNFFQGFRSGEGFPRATLTQFSFPFSLVVLFTYIIRQYWRALHDSERLNQELVERVRAATAELEEHLNQQHQQKLQESTLQERQKIYRDLHDDVGARLTSILHAADSDRQKQMARAALESLRATIHHANYRGQTLQELLDTAAEEMQIRLQAAGLTFEADTAALASDRELGSSESYHLTRALREITNNILHHAGASTVQLSARENGEGGYVLEIQDDGRGLEPGCVGNGLRNIEQRMQELQGRANWISTSGRGCKVQLWIPVKSTEAALA